MKVSAKTAKAVYEAQSAAFWIWFALACCEGDAITAILALAVKSLTYALMHRDLEDWEKEEAQQWREKTARVLVVKAATRHATQTANNMRNGTAGTNRNEKQYGLQSKS